MSRLKNVSPIAWFVAGVALTAILVPSVALASGVIYNGIQGTNGSTSTLNKAGVTSTHQLQVGEATPSSYFAMGGSFQFSLLDVGSEIASPPSGKSLIVQGLHVSWVSAGSGDALQIFEDKATDPYVCQVAYSNGDVLSYPDYIAFPTTNGTIALPYEPGFIVPAGYVLCAAPISSSVSGEVNVYGYQVPMAQAPAFYARGWKGAHLHVKR